MIRRKNIILFIALIGCISRLEGGDRSPSRTSIRPTGVPVAAIPEMQTEGHTCGWHAIRSIYKSYRLSVEDYDLKARLGVDKVSVPFFRSTRGTVHPDILRVLDQDGFDFEIVQVSKPENLKKLNDHLESGYSALVLVNRRENNALHWIVVATKKRGDYLMVDSLKAESYPEELDFLKQNAQTVLLIRPQAAKSMGKGKSQRKGLWEGLKSLF